MRIVILLAILAVCLAKPKPNRGRGKPKLGKEALKKKPSSHILNPDGGPEDGLEGKAPEDNEAVEGHELHEGDIVVPKGHNGKNRNAVKYNEQKWQKKDGIVHVPYVFDPSLSCTALNAIAKAMHDYAKYTCIHFAPRDTATDKYYIRFFRGGGCYSSVGRMQEFAQYGHTQFKEKQDISIGYGCEYKGTAAHEMMHAMGFQHEQSRPDRDQYVSVHKDHIKSGMEHNFDKCDERVCTTQGLPYDYDSVMHYGKNYFTKDGRDTLVPKDPNAEIGQRKGFSEMDVQKLNKLYNCDDAHIGKPLEKEPPTSQNGQDCGKMRCRDRYSNCGDYKFLCKVHPVVIDGCKATCGDTQC